MARLALLLALLIAAPSLAEAQTNADAEKLLARAIELHQAGDILGAIDSYKAALAIAPDRGDALSNLGAAYVRLGQFDDAIAQYNHALKNDPTQHVDSAEPGARLLQVGAAATRGSRAQTNRRLES